jgi:hypothetical protein
VQRIVVGRNRTLVRRRRVLTPSDDEYAIDDEECHPTVTRRTTEFADALDLEADDDGGGNELPLERFVATTSAATTRDAFRTEMSRIIEDIGVGVAGVGSVG